MKGTISHETQRNGNRRQNTNYLRCAGDHDNDVQHRRRSHGTNKRIYGSKEYCSRSRRLRGRIRMAGRVQGVEEERIQCDRRSEFNYVSRKTSPPQSARLLRRTAPSFSSVTRMAALSSPKLATIREWLGWCISPLSRPIGANRCPRYSKIRLP